MPWKRQLAKAAAHIRRGDLVGLKREITQYLAWRGIGVKGSSRRSGRASTTARSTDRPGIEARYWALADVEMLRKTSWSSIQCLGPMAVLEITGGRTGNVLELLAKSLKTSRRDGLRGLVLGGGDMMAEHANFINPPLEFTEIDVYDINGDAFEKARLVMEQAGLKANFFVGDVNETDLPADTYHQVLVFQAYHHFEQVERIASQINTCLAPGGVFYTIDYIGPCRLQYSDRQLFYAQLLLEALPERCRKEVSGSIRQKVKRVDPATLSPDEAICSDRILPALNSALDVIWQYNWAGLLYPLLEGIAFNFDENDPADRVLIEYLFNLDRVLCQRGHVEPSFTITIARKKV